MKTLFFIAFGVVLLALASFSFAATGFDYPNPTTLRLFNDAGGLPFCINTTTGIQAENCENEWSDNEWCAVLETRVGLKARHCISDGLLSYRVASDNATYANVTFSRGIGAYSFSVNYNLSKDDKLLSITPNFTTGRFSVLKGTKLWFEWHTKNIRVNGTNESDFLWYNEEWYDLNSSATTSLGNSSSAHALEIYDAESEKAIFLNWESGANVTLTLLPQPGWPNREANLSVFLGTLAPRSSYAHGFLWNDADIVCSDGTAPSLVCSVNTTNTTTETQITFTVLATKFDASAVCTYKNRHQPGTQFASYTANYPTGIVTRAVGKGTDSTQSTTSTTILFHPMVGGRNGTANFRINSVTTFCSDIAVQAWDVKPPHNATINTTNMTNYTNSNIFVFAFGVDNTHIIAEELYSNVSGEWQLTSFINSTANRVANRSYGFNFSVAASDGCYLFGAGIRDSGNNLNMSANYTFCKNTSILEGYNTQEDPLSCNFPSSVQNQSIPILCTSNNGTGAQITNSLIRCQAYWAGNFSTAPLSVQSASNAIHTTNGTYVWMLNPPFGGAMYTVNCSAAFAVTANAPAAPAGTIFVFPNFAQQDNTSQIRADMALNTSAIINNQVFSNNSLHAAMGLNSSNVISTIVVGNNSIHMAMGLNASNVIYTIVSANNTVLQQMAVNSSFLLAQMALNTSNVIFTVVTANNTLLAAYADNTSNVINTFVVGNNSLNSNLALNYTALKSLIEESNSSTATQMNITTLLDVMNAELKIQASPAQSFYNNSDLIVEFTFSNNTGAFSSLDSLSIQLVQANGTVYNSTYATTVGLVNGTYLYNVSINENNSGIWTVRVNATKNGVTAISSYNLRLYGGVFMFSITTDQNVYDTVTGTIFLLNEGADNTEDGTLETWVSTSATCSPIMDGTYTSEQLKPPAIGNTKLLTRQKTFQRLQDTLYYCGKWAYADFQTATATAAFTISVVGGGWFGSALLPTWGGIPPSFASCENLEGFDEFMCNSEVWLTGRDLSYSKTGYIPNFFILIAVLGFFIFVLYKRKHPKISIAISIIIVILLLRYFGRA